MSEAACADLEAAVEPMVSTDPLEELTGWHAEPILLRRLNLYIAEGIVECSALAVAMRAAQRLGVPTDKMNMMHSPTEFFTRLLMFPLCVTSLKLAWTLSLAFGYYWHSGSNFGRRLHKRNVWTWSATLLTCLSCMLMMWHAITFLCLVGYDPAPGDQFFVRFVMCVNGMLTIAHWLIWRDFAKSRSGTEDVDPNRLNRLKCIYRMYKYKAIQLRKYMDVADQRTPSSKPSTCMICMEDFMPAKDVSLLPCGHCFHPTCINKWLCEKWVCPLRCALDGPYIPKIGPAADATVGDAQFPSALSPVVPSSNLPGSSVPIGSLVSTGVLPGGVPGDSPVSIVVFPDDVRVGSPLSIVVPTAQSISVLPGGGVPMGSTVSAGASQGI